MNAKAKNATSNRSTKYRSNRFQPAPAPAAPAPIPGAAHQTRTFLRKRFDDAGIHPKTRYGQNFLIDLNLVELLASSAALGPDDVVLEIGCGTGALTARMARQAAVVIAVEVDYQLAQLAREHLSTLPNVVLLEQDALHNKNNMHPDVMAEVRKHLAAAPGRRLKLAANLPYNIATPIISNLLASEPLPHSMTVTIQKELGERICAKPGTKDYSALTIWVQSQAQPRIIRIMPPDVFWPRPKVESAIIGIDVEPERRAAIHQIDFYHEFVRGLFCHRRKFLRSQILNAARGRLEKPAVDALLERQQLDPTLRAERLSVEQFVALVDDAYEHLSPE